MYFLNLAKKVKKPIVELEGVMFQMKMISGYSDKLQELLLLEQLKMTDKEKEEGKKYLAEMYQAWLDGDVKTLEKLVEEDTTSLTTEEQALYEEYNNAMMVDRNKGMVDKAVEMLEDDKKVFYMVGAAHMYGDTGLVKQLEEKGYKVTLKK
jgi:uncharacterized protein YbaP (TraB family)